MNITDNKESNVIIIGAGAAGLIVAGRLRERGIEPLILEKTNRAGKKLAITGKGRCNVTNNCDIQTLIANVQTNPRFLYAAFSNFGPSDTMALFERLGVSLKTERGNRVFPSSDNAHDIVDALKKYAGNCVITDKKVTELIFGEFPDVGKKIKGVKVRSSHGESVMYAENVIIATGGKSYPLTGSEGDGYKLAESVGHTVTPITPSLVPLECKEKFCSEMMGLSLRNVGIKVVDTAKNGTVVYEDFGEMLFTHFGISGPTVLSASAHLKNITDGRYKFIIDLKPALDEKTLDNRILSDFSKYANKIFANSLGDLLPSKMIPVFIRMTEINPEKKVNTITKEERRRIVSTLKSFTVTVKGTRTIDEAIVTSGGIKVGEINPKTMESKLVSGLYFAGEVIDVDAYTGGFNLQIAFSTGVCAADHICVADHIKIR